jgi:hypothetical protein
VAWRGHRVITLAAEAMEFTVERFIDRRLATGRGAVRRQLGLTA